MINLVSRHLFKNASCNKSAQMSIDHLTKTGNNYRQNTINTALVEEVTQLSRTVKGVTIKVLGSNFSFMAGQWVDVFVPGVKQVGGFSMCSAPTVLTESSILQLAVKASNSPPARWMHDQCKVGDKLQLRAGGDVYFTVPPIDQKMPDLLLIAGGVGINPLWSIVQEIKEQKITFHHRGLPKNVSLLYSSSNADELLFKDVFFKVKEELGGCFSLKLFVTKEMPDSLLNLDPRLLVNLKGRRMRSEDIQDSLNNCDKSHLNCFLCGPPGMIDYCREILQILGVPDKFIKFEKWW